MFAAIGDEVGNGCDFQAVQLGERNQVRHAGHGAVVIHDLADNPGGIETGKPGQINGCFRMSGAHKDTTFARDQGKYMTRRRNVFGASCGVDGDRHGPRPVVG